MHVCILVLFCLFGLIVLGFGCGFVFCFCFRSFGLCLLLVCFLFGFCCLLLVDWSLLPTLLLVLICFWFLNFDFLFDGVWWEIVWRRLLLIFVWLFCLTCCFDLSMCFVVLIYLYLVVWFLLVVADCLVVRSSITV